MRPQEYLTISLVILLFSVIGTGFAQSGSNENDSSQSSGQSSGQSSSQSSDQSSIEDNSKENNNNVTQEISKIAYCIRNTGLGMFIRNMADTMWLILSILPEEIRSLYIFYMYNIRNLIVILITNMERYSSNVMEFNNMLKRLRDIIPIRTLLKFNK
ncbi:uncharacterized protein LOC109855271 [Pseudomyrmex gracilis]|uniref:uncharacterized protein LOC109855271 n=1 Tax=Pseudomyrmex gracilis TaxID=219809 RepID=UPI000994992B|nr:uncharacterized protein LOC109855271 [Pseudomyrmex gracilis]